jgi:cellulose synthase/poly-beta-1,6-N-acetylglucosamine synthase-like glycosyltransferase
LNLNDVVLGFNYLVLLYFLAINGVYLVLYVLSFVEISYAVKRDLFAGLSELFASNYAPPISVVVPAYNESATIVTSVHSLLALRYPAHEVVVVNDGSKDDTLEVLKEEFGLYESDQPIWQQIKTSRIRGVYVSPSERLVVVDKENGGRSDAQNAGICAANYPLVCCTDADVLMEEDALLRVARPMVESSEVVGVGGFIRVANGCVIDSGRVVEARTPKNPLPNFQIVEYLRAFLAGRTGWSTLNCMLIISGAFGLFRRQDVIEAGGLATDSIGEDMELTMRMHRTLREKKVKYRIVFVPDPVAWTEVPDTLRVLGRQRDRWHRGLTDTLIRNKKMLFNPRYGTVGLLAMPYFLIFEWLGPIIELVGYVAFILGLTLGIINLEFALLFFIVAVGLGALLSVAAVFLEELRLRRYPRWRDLGKLTAYGILENFGYRQLNTYWRVKGLISFVRKNTEWGEMERKGFAPAKKHKKNPS